MRFFRLCFIILKNLPRAIFEEIRERVRSFGLGKTILILIILIAAVSGGFWYFEKRSKDGDVMLEKAAKAGELTERKMMIQIENPKGNPADIPGRYERGDIVLILSADHQFSDAEKAGFLIVKMKLTGEQAELMVRAKEEDLKKSDRPEDAPKDEPMAKTLKRRRFTADLSKMGIASNDEKGREIEDNVFEWEVVEEK